MTPNDRDTKMAEEIGDDDLEQMSDHPDPCIGIPDPWIHRSKGMLCLSCMYFVVKASSLPTRFTARGQIGRCRRHAPTMRGYPVTFESDWCGDHKMDEDKI